MATKRVRLQISAEEPDIGAKIITDIGRAIISWANFEATIDHEIRHLQKQPSAGKLALEGAISTKRRVDLWKRLTNRIYANQPSYPETVRVLAKQTRVLAEHRNVLGHGIWRGHVPPDAFQLATIKSDKGKLFYVEHTIGLDGLEWLLESIKSLHEATIKYLIARHEGREIRVHLGKPPPTLGG
jgi:hypothetical protein